LIPITVEDKDKDQSHRKHCDFLLAVVVTVLPVFRSPVQIGAPIPVQKKQSSEITPQDIEALHATFCKAMQELFEKSKSKHGCDASTKLLIL
jgi:hypothetical protein